MSRWLRSKHKGLWLGDKEVDIKDFLCFLGLSSWLLTLGLRTIDNEYLLQI